MQNFVDVLISFNENSQKPFNELAELLTSTYLLCEHNYRAGIISIMKDLHRINFGNGPHVSGINDLNVRVGLNCNIMRVPPPSACHIPTPSGTVKPKESDRHLLCADDGPRENPHHDR